MVTFCQFLQNTFYFDDFLVTEETLVHWEYHSAGDGRSCLKVQEALSTSVKDVAFLLTILLISDFIFPGSLVEWD